MMFIDYPGYDPRRTIEEVPNDVLIGEDVFALQTALGGNGLKCDPGPADGVAGQRTIDAIVRAQLDLDLYVDGRAGEKTHSAITKALILNVICASSSVLGRWELAQITHESGRWLGMYSSPPRADGSYDAGIAQRNTEHTTPKDGFSVPKSLAACRDSLQEHYNLFSGVQGDRRWHLAVDAWNTPAWACRLAWEEGAKGVPAARRWSKALTADQREIVETYISLVAAKFE